MKLVYISGAYRSKFGINGIAENIWKARKVALKYWKLGFAVICPHLNTAFLDGSCPDQVWLKGDLEMLKRCDIIVMLKGYKKSSGALEELALAKEERLEVIYE